MSHHSVHPLHEYKIQASLLRKQLRSADADAALLAAMRFQQLPHLLHLTVDEVLAQKTAVQRKHALRVIALENGFASWSELKHALDRYDAYQTSRHSRMNTLLYPPRCQGFVNEWHADYAVAKETLTKHGGYLLPYRNQFFICQPAYIEALGLDPHDADWASMGWNWVEPHDEEAKLRLQSKLLARAEGEIA